MALTLTSVTWAFSFIRRHRGKFVLLALLIVGLLFFVLRGKNDKLAIRYETQKMGRGDIVARVTATGTLSALVTVQIGSQVSGRLIEINVDYNSPVKKGEVLAKIDPEIFKAQREQAKANLLAANSGLAKAQAQAADAERQFARAKGLLEQKMLAQAEYDTAESNKDVTRSQILAAEGAVAQARAALHQAEINLAYTTIVSPINGMVISRAVDVGQTVAASFQAPTLFTIAEDLTRMQVDTNVSEADVGKITTGMKATFTVDAYPGETFEGTVRQVRNAPITVSNVVTYDTVLDVANPKLFLRPGMTASVTFVYARKDGVLRVPNAALRFKPAADILAAMKREMNGEKDANGPGGKGEGEISETAKAEAARLEREKAKLGERTLWLLRDKTPKSVAVKVGLTDGSTTELVEGALKEGDEVIVDAVKKDEKKAAISFGGPPPKK